MLHSREGEVPFTNLGMYTTLRFTQNVVARHSHRLNVCFKPGSKERARHPSFAAHVLAAARRAFEAGREPGAFRFLAADWAPQRESMRLLLASSRSLLSSAANLGTVRSKNERARPPRARIIRRRPGAPAGPACDLGDLRPACLCWCCRPAQRPRDARTGDGRTQCHAVDGALRDPHSLL